jgi:ATP-dependent Lon protease
MLDEVDKLGRGIQGDPAAALLEVLDPAQNYTFVDTYLSVPFDLSRVLFICTANTIETIPSPLLDRLEILSLSGYTEMEKLHIAHRYLLPKQLRANGLQPDELKLTDAALQRIIREYTREAGVRNSEREIGTVVRKVARKIAAGATTPISIEAEQIPDYLRRPRFENEVIERIDRPGIATGLAWTPAGGDVLFIEATMMPGRDERLVLTGMLGDVMRESAQAALSYVRSNAEKLGIEPKAFVEKVVHVHVPAGATPKDGPSAGVTMVTAIASVAAGRLVRNDVAMTGEITLRGKVLPVGGIREKVLAAYRAGVKMVILPQRNEPDLEDVPNEVRRDLQFVFASAVEDVLAAALMPVNHTP